MKRVMNSHVCLTIRMILVIALISPYQAMAGNRANMRPQALIAQEQAANASVAAPLRTTPLYEAPPVATGPQQGPAYQDAVFYLPPAQPPADKSNAVAPGMIQGLADMFSQFMGAANKADADPNANQDANVDEDYSKLPPHPSFTGSTHFDTPDTDEEYHEDYSALMSKAHPDIVMGTRSAPTAAGDSSLGNVVSTPINMPDANSPEIKTAATNLAGHKCTNADHDRLTCMVCNIYFEAGNEPARGQVEVGKSVLAREYNKRTMQYFYDHKSPYPMTACSAIYAPWQYSWTKLNSDTTMLKGKRLQRAIAAAKEAIAEGPGEYSNYYAPSGMKPVNSLPNWAGDCTSAWVTIGTQKFCKVVTKRTRTFAEVEAAEERAGSASVDEIKRELSSVPSVSAGAVN